jgi:hypothetical protein
MTQSEERPSALPGLAQYMTTCFVNQTSISDVVAREIIYPPLPIICVNSIFFYGKW